MTSSALPPDAPRSRRRFVKPALILLVLIAVAGTFAGLRNSEAKKETRKEEKVRTFELAPGDVAMLERLPLGRQIPLSGTLRPVLSATVRAKVPAEVSRVLVQEGQRVEAGQVLVALDTADLRPRLDREMVAGA